MQKIFNKDGFNWWIGVVEDRNDPEKLGRCRVRIFGYHTESRTLLPTKQLPWAIPIQPITSAAISGIGTTPIGPLEGTWVMGFFLDGEDMQQPAMLGTISTSTVKAAGFKLTEDVPSVRNKNDGMLKDSQGNPVFDSEGNPVRVGTAVAEGWELGQTSEKYESGGKGPGTINEYNGAAGNDLGGASYGTYQLASYLPEKMINGRARPSAKNSPVLQFIANSKFKDRFTNKTPATADFDNTWRTIALQFPAEFKDDQHDYIQSKYYNVYVANLQRAGLDVTKFGPAVQDLVWSTAVQFGPARTSIFTEPLKNKSVLTDKEIVILVSDYKIASVNIFFASSSENIRNGAKSRFESEKSSLLNLA